MGEEWIQYALWKRRRDVLRWHRGYPLSALESERAMRQRALRKISASPSCFLADRRPVIPTGSTCVCSLQDAIRLENIGRSVKYPKSLLQIASLEGKRRGCLTFSEASNIGTFYFCCKSQSGEGEFQCLTLCETFKT